MVDDWPNVREWSNLLGRRWWEGPEGAGVGEGGGGKTGGAEMIKSLVLHIHTCTCLLNEQTPAISLLD